MQKFLIAFRNLNRQKKRSFLLGGAIAFGILAITMINGLVGGFVENLGENYSRLLAGQIFIQGLELTASGRRVQAIRDDRALVAAIDGAGLPLRGVLKSSGFLGTLMFHGVSADQQIVGLDWAQSGPLTERLSLKEGSFAAMRNPRGIVVSEKTASKLNARAGDGILVRLKTLTGQENVGEFEIVAISYDPALSESFAAYANLSYVNALLDLGAGEYQTLGILLGGTEGIDTAAQKLFDGLRGKVPVFDREASSRAKNPVRAMLQQHQQNPMASMYQSLLKRGGDSAWSGTRYRLYTLNDLTSQVNLPQTVDALKGLASLVLLIVLVIVMVGVANTFRVIIYERTGEIGTMRALGMKRSAVRDLILLEALFLSVGGALAGLAASAVLMGLLRLVDFGVGAAFSILLKDGRLTFLLSAPEALLSIALVAALTLLAVFFPARRAARLNPADALRVAR